LIPGFEVWLNRLRSLSVHRDCRGNQQDARNRMKGSGHEAILLLRERNTAGLKTRRDGINRETTL
jgi:hypothetical protein